MLTIPDDVRRLLESEEMQEFSDLCNLSDARWDRELSDIRFFADCADWDDEPVCTDNYHDDADLEVALEQCPFDFDELADNMIDSGPEF
jgi:hypothetical protein